MDNTVQLLQCINFSLPGKTTAFLHAWLGEKSFSFQQALSLPAHALACIVDFILAISQLVQCGF
jgi:hypothetical protein